MPFVNGCTGRYVLPGNHLQSGAVGTLFLVPLALVGALTLLLVTLGVVYWEGRAPVTDPPGDSPGRPQVTLTAGSAPHELPAALQADYDRSCRVCHDTPGTGAPRAGDLAAWQPRLAQGLDALLEHTVSGFQGMPPMGMCMHCSRGTFIAFIQYMGQFRAAEDCPP